jgi:hypothetical protein
MWRREKTARYHTTEVQPPRLTIVGSILLPGDQRLRMEKGPVWARLDVVNDTRLQVDVKRSWNMFPLNSTRKERLKNRCRSEKANPPVHDYPSKSRTCLRKELLRKRRDIPSIRAQGCRAPLAIKGDNQKNHERQREDSQQALPI